jgi:SAM-dependent methyltransferase
MKPMVGLEVYDDAALYDQEFATRTKEIPFYVRQARRIGGPVLEVACGTGRLTLPIAAEGIPITGVDVSPAMLARAREKSADIDWQLQDARSMELGRRFALVFMATNALQHLHDVDEVLTFLDRARTHLKPDGSLILDVFHPSVEKLARVLGSPRHHKRFSLADGRLIDVTSDSEYLRESQILHFVLTYRHEGKVVHTKDVRLRCFFPNEMIALCRLGGFRVKERFGDYDERPFDDNSPQQILVCEAADALPRK